MFANICARGQNLLESDLPGGTINQLTPQGTESLFASGLNSPSALAFDDFGDLFVTEEHNGTITEITPGGMTTVFATGLNSPSGLAVNAAGDLFAFSLFYLGSHGPTWYDWRFVGLACVIVFPDERLSNLNLTFNWRHLVWLEVIFVGIMVVGTIMLKRHYPALRWYSPLVAIGLVAINTGHFVVL